MDRWAAAKHRRPHSPNRKALLKNGPCVYIYIYVGMIESFRLWQFTCQFIPEREYVALTSTRVRVQFVVVIIFYREMFVIELF